MRPAQTRLCTVSRVLVRRALHIRRNIEHETNDAARLHDLSRAFARAGITCRVADTSQMVNSGFMNRSCPAGCCKSCCTRDLHRSCKHERALFAQTLQRLQIKPHAATTFCPQEGTPQMHISAHSTHNECSTQLSYAHLVHPPPFCTCSCRVQRER